MAIFAALHTAWTICSDTVVERLVIDQATVSVAAVWVRLLTPDIPVVADGTKLSAPGGGINVLKGCEGTEVLFLLAAAFMVAPLTWRRRLGGLALGAWLVYLMNQVRVVVLFYAYRYDQPLFGQLHGTVAPLIMVALTGSFFFWMSRTAHDGTATIR